MECLVHNVVEREDGGADVDVQYDEEFMKEASVWYSERHDLSEEKLKDVEDQVIVQEFVINCLEEGIQMIEEEETEIKKEEDK